MQRNLSPFFRLLTILSVLFLFSALAIAAPNILNYQGTLTDDLDNPVTGTKSIVFKIYNVPAGGTALWSSGSMTVNVENGLFNVAIEGFPDDLFSEDNRYMELLVEGAVLSQRKRMTSVPYALNAGSANSGGIPAGGIIMWSGAANQIPEGWALCNGQNGTPNLVDRFVVGAGAAYAVKATGGNAVNNLSHSHTVNNHTHHIDVQFTSCIGDCKDGADDGSKSVGSDSHGHHLITDTWGAAPGTNAQLSIEVENRPPYFALCFIMKLP